MAQIALCEARGPLTDLLQKLSGEDGARWLKGLNQFLRQHREVRSELQTWKTIKLGIFGTIQELQKAVENNGFQNVSRTVDIPKNVSVAQSVSQIELVKITMRDLGFENGVRFSELYTRVPELYTRAKEFGLEILPPEAALQLCCQFGEQHYFDDIYVGTEHLAGKSGRPYVFWIRRHATRGRLLGTISCDRRIWFGPSRWIFGKQK